MREIRVRGWAEIQELLYEASWQPHLGRFRSNEVFRGMSCARDSLTTSLVRLGGAPETPEEHLLRTFRRYAHRHDAGADSLWNWLALAQHHHLPTRLLDWTYSPLVAMHFATVNLRRYDEDGVIWCVDYARRNHVIPKPLRTALEREGATVFTTEMLAECAPSLRALDQLTREPFVLFFEPPSLDDRIINQFALFSVMSSPSARLDHWLRAHPDTGRRIIIPAELKWEIRDKLDGANITERVLFPGLDGLRACLKNRTGVASVKAWKNAPHIQVI